MTLLKELKDLSRGHKGTPAMSVAEGKEFKQMLDVLHVKIEEPELHL